MCPDWPGYFVDHFAINVAISPRLCANIFVNVLNKVALSAALRIQSGASAASSTPGPVSV